MKPCTKTAIFFIIKVSVTKKARDHKLEREMP